MSLWNEVGEKFTALMFSHRVIQSLNNIKQRKSYEKNPYRIKHVDIENRSNIQQKQTYSAYVFSLSLSVSKMDDLSIVPVQAWNNTLKKLFGSKIACLGMSDRSIRHMILYSRGAFCEQECGFLLSAPFA